MNRDFWLARWREGRIGWHRSSVMPLLARHWPQLALPRGARVLVPLAGKSLDMIWLAAQGYRVLGVEWSPAAIEQFFAENRLAPVERAAAHGSHFTAGDIELVCGDVMALGAEVFADCAAVYDRAALIALSEPARRCYAEDVYAKLPPGCRGLLITLEYPQAERAGPPFSVEDDEVHRLLDERWDVALLERRDVLAQDPGSAPKGVTACHTTVFRLELRA
ncbi:MAG: thiopurine S-methyltransferase [Steroidobacteraceae bacterium]